MAINIAYSPYRSTFGSSKRRSGWFSFGNRKRRGGFASVHQTREVRGGFSRRREGLNLGNEANSVKESVVALKSAVMRLEFGPTMTVMMLGFTCVALMVFYLAVYNKIATKGYDLKRLEAIHSQLMAEYDVSNMKMAQIKSLANIVQSDRLSVMRHPNEVGYVMHDGTVIAQAN